MSDRICWNITVPILNEAGETLQDGTKEDLTTELVYAGGPLSFDEAARIKQTQNGLLKCTTQDVISYLELLDKYRTEMVVHARQKNMEQLTIRGLPFIANIGQFASPIGFYKERSSIK